MTKNKLLDSNQLKIIAIVAMTVDHIAWMLFPGYPREALPVVMHIIGRLARLCAIYSRGISLY